MRLTAADVMEALGGPHPGFATPSPIGMGEGPIITTRVPLDGQDNHQEAQPFAIGPSPFLKGEGWRSRGGGALDFTGVSTDTRTLQPGELFVALVSPNADGHDFIPQALAQGASGVVVSRDVGDPGVPVFVVPDTEVAYGRLARLWRDRFDIPVIGVTGSVGKTTLKEMLAAALRPLGPVLRTAASQNNETGVPKALLQLTPEHRVAVVEMGMRGVGQIAYLCGIARPTVGVITVISDNHIELLGSRDAIADAKGELLEALPADGLAVLNAADPYFERLRAKTAARVVAYGAGPLTAEDVSPGARGWRFTAGGVPVEVASPSRHDVTNALAALAVAVALGVPLAQAAEALAGYAPPPMRMQVTPTPWGGTVLNDAYNAAPASMRSALETLTGYGGGRKIAFLGDMKELGDNAVREHQALGETVAELGGLDALYAVGGLAAQIPGAAEYFPSSAEAASFASSAFPVRPGDVILVKGSRAMAMERIAEALTARAA